MQRAFCKVQTNIQVTTISHMLDGPTLQSARGFFTQPTFRLKGGEFFWFSFLGGLRLEIERNIMF
jgi:hypothetical protein